MSSGGRGRICKTIHDGAQDAVERRRGAGPGQRSSAAATPASRGGTCSTSRMVTDPSRDNRRQPASRRLRPGLDRTGDNQAFEAASFTQTRWSASRSRDAEGAGDGGRRARSPPAHGDVESKTPRGWAARSRRGVGLRVRPHDTGGTRWPAVPACGHGARCAGVKLGCMRETSTRYDDDPWSRSVHPAPDSAANLALPVHDLRGGTGPGCAYGPVARRGGAHVIGQMRTCGRFPEKCGPDGGRTGSLATRFTVHGHRAGPGAVRSSRDHVKN